MDQITITKDQFHNALSAEVAELLKSAEKAGGGVSGMLAVMLATTFGAALSNRLFNNDEEESEDGADS